MRRRAIRETTCPSVMEMCFQKLGPYSDDGSVEQVTDAARIEVVQV